MNNTVTSASALVPVFNGQLQNQTVKLCNARELHNLLPFQFESEDDFAEGF
jgi:phage anti-repressor protein